MANVEKEIAISKDLANDQNFLAYSDAAESGIFDDMEPGTWVVFYEGRLFDSGMDRLELMRKLDEQGIGPCFIHQVGVPERVVLVSEWIADKL